MTDTTNLPTDPNDNKQSENKELQLSDLTDKNWLFIKHFIESGDIEKAYTLAGYEGSAPSTKYDLFKKLKPYIEELLSLGKVSRIALINDLQKALAIPLVQRDAVTVSEFIRLRKFAASLIPELKEKSSLSVLVVNRYNGPKGSETTNVTPSTTPNNIIEGEIIG